MSEADADAGRDDVWVEKYRPQRLQDVVGHETITERIQQYVAGDDLPNLLFAGPAGVGKCVTGTTPVLTDRGVERIEDVVGDVDGFAEPDDGLEVLTFDGGEFEYTAPSRVFGKRADETVTVNTRDGGETTTTPEHRFLVLDADGFTWRRAEDLDSGDRIARPLEVPTLPDEPELGWIDELDGDRVLLHVTETFADRYDVPLEEEFVGKRKQAIRGFRKGRTDLEIASRCSMQVETVADYRRQTTELDLDRTADHCSLSFVRDLDVDEATLRDHVEAIQYATRWNRRAEPISPVWTCSPELAEFVGLAISEARIEESRIKFYNTDDRLLDRFEGLAESLFDVQIDRGVQKDVGYVSVQSRTLLHFLGSCFDVVDVDDSSGIGSTLLQAPAESQSAFLRAMFDTEAYVSEHGIVELTQKKGSYITLLSYLLTGFGIPSRRRTETKAATNGSGTEREYHTLLISGSRHLRRFQSEVGFDVDHKAERVERAVAQESNPNHDTIPAQNALHEVCEGLYLPKSDLLTDTLDPDTPGRVAHVDDVERVVEAAAKRLETAQEVRQRVERLRSDLGSVSKIPATWESRRSEIEPGPVRATIGASVGARSDYLLEYARGDRLPRANRAVSILEEIGAISTRPPVERVQQILSDAIERLEVPYNHVAEGTEYRGTDVINLLQRDDHDLASLTRFALVADRVVDIASEMLTEEVLASIRTLDVLSRDTLYFDEVVEVERTGEAQRVYDLTVPGTENYVAGAVPTVMHNTTTAVAIAKEIYDEDWREHFLELNASDERGIDVVRGRIKDFARTSFSGDRYGFRIIFLDEADALTSDAQSALRRTMEQFSGNTRFVLSCNYSSRIIDPIQSRCAVFRFPPLADEAIRQQVEIVADAEGIEVTEDGYEAIAYAADGDMRRAINALQAAATLGARVDEEAVYEITSTARPEEVLEMVQHAVDGDFLAARSALESLLIDRGIAGGDVIDQLHRSVWDLDVEEAAAVRLMDRVGEAEYRIVAGADERIQLEAMLASLALETGD